MIDPVENPTLHEGSGRVALNPKASPPSPPTCWQQATASVVQPDGYSHERQLQHLRPPPLAQLPQARLDHLGAVADQAPCRGVEWLVQQQQVDGAAG